MTAGKLCVKIVRGFLSDAEVSMICKLRLVPHITEKEKASISVTTRTLVRIIAIGSGPFPKLGV